MTQELKFPSSHGQTTALNSSAATTQCHRQNEAIATPRPEYPRPDFQRDDASWLNLNGCWEFGFDDDQQGYDQGWFHQRHLPTETTIQVPFAFQSQLSGIGDPNLHDYMWYARDFELPAEWAGRDQRFMLRFGAVDYYCQVWVNGQAVGNHRGGHVPFSFDITDQLKAGEPNRIVVYVEDTQSKHQPRGKQYWKLASEHCFYTRTSGIWQTVWLEALPQVYLNHLKVQSDIDREEVAFAIEFAGRLPVGEEEIYWLGAEISFEGARVWQGAWNITTDDAYTTLLPVLAGDIKLANTRLWSPETPHLYDLHLTLYRGQQPLDEVQSYFGMRKISSENGRVLLNNQPYYLRLILDQGYFPDGLLTAPSDDALRRDVEVTKAFGFNGARKHQKIEDPRWLYWADRLGLLVWGEMPSASEWHAGAERHFIEEWLQAIVRDYNHPCIMTWVPFNESWGIEGVSRDPRQQAFVQRVVALTRDMDKTRLVIDNDGWEHLDNASDLLTIHDYTAHGPELLKRYSHFGRDGQIAQLPLVSERPILLPGSGYQGQPILFTEMGGISLIPASHVVEAKAHGDWGYSNVYDSSHLIEQYRSLIEAINELGFSSGFCYTQLTDVEQEVNGLLTYNRQPKVEPSEIARLNELLVTKLA